MFSQLQGSGGLRPDDPYGGGVSAAPSRASIVAMRRRPGAEPPSDLCRRVHDPQHVPPGDRSQVLIGVAARAELFEHERIRRDVGELLAHRRHAVVVAADADVRRRPRPRGCDRCGRRRRSPSPNLAVAPAPTHRSSRDRVGIVRVRLAEPVHLVPPRAAHVGTFLGHEPGHERRHDDAAGPADELEHVVGHVARHVGERAAPEWEKITGASLTSSACRITSSETWLQIDQHARGGSSRARPPRRTA